MCDINQPTQLEKGSNQIFPQLSSLFGYYKKVQGNALEEIPQKVGGKSPTLAVIYGLDLYLTSVDY